MAERSEAGFVLAKMALLLIPLTIFVAMSVDIGGWYWRAQQTQVAADAAALAGVPYMPNVQRARQTALETAARNGFVDQPGCDGNPQDCVPTSFPQVVVTPFGQNRVEVTIFTTADVYFGKVVLPDQIPVTRFAVSQVRPPVPLGNPTSVLGSGADEVAGSVSNYWLRAMPECEPRSTGDLVGAGGGCPTTTNPNYRDEGHTFIVDVPLDGNYDIQARTTCAEFGGNQANASMRFRLFGLDDTPYDDSDNILQPPISETVVTRPDATICPLDGSGWSPGNEPAPWQHLASVTDAGRYVLQAKNPEYTAAIRSLYSLRVVPSGFDQACSRIGPSGTGGCPTILARDSITSYTNANMFPDGLIGQAQLFLAEIEEYYAGDTMEITLFDPADGVDEVRIVDPDGNYAYMTWYTVDCAAFGYDCARGDIGSAADQRYQQCGLDACLRQEGGVSFQDRTVRILVDVPVGYQCPTPPSEPKNCWWKVEYRDSNGDTSETMTWSVAVRGDPIRLVE